MLIGLVGHPVKLDVVERNLLQLDNSLEIRRLEIAEVPLPCHIEQYKKLQQSVNLMIIGGYYDYLFFSNNIIFGKVTGYIARDEMSLYRVFLEAQSKGRNIFNISIDGYRKESVLELYAEIDYCGESRVFDWYENDLLSLQTVRDMIAFHECNFRQHRVALCITCISVVYERLRELGIPVLLVSSTFEEVRVTYEKLRLEYLLKAKETGDILMLDVSVSGTELSAEAEDDDQLTLEKLRMAENIFLFAQKLQAAVEEMNLGRYLIVVDKLILERETVVYKNISLLSDVKKLRHCKISIGIGSGNSPREAMSNARSARKKAKQSGFSCAYIVYDNVNIVGPIHSDHFEKSTVAEHPCLAIAEQTHLSVNTLYKLQAIIDKYKNNVFTVNELSLIYGISLRSMYRIIDKLEIGGYITEKGKKMTDGSGRPSRIIQMNLGG